MNKPCRKTQFATEHDALFYIAKLKKTSKRKVLPKRAYLCPICFSWHLTSAEIEPHNEFEVKHWRQKYTNEIKRLKLIIAHKDDLLRRHNAEILRLNQLVMDIANHEIEVSFERER